MVDIKIVKTVEYPEISLDKKETRAFMDLLNWVNSGNESIENKEDDRAGAKTESFETLNKVWHEVDDCILEHMGYGDDYDEYYFESQ